MYLLYKKNDMIRHFYLVSSFLLCMTTAFGQNPYSDAARLRKLIGNDGKFRPEDTPAADTILSRYLTGDQTISSEFGTKNIFIRDFFQLDEPHSSIPPSRRGIMRTLGSIDVTSFSQGVSMLHPGCVANDSATAVPCGDVECNHLLASAGAGRPG